MAGGCGCRGVTITDIQVKASTARKVMCDGGAVPILWFLGNR